MSVDDMRDRLDIDIPEGEYVTSEASCSTASGTSPKRASR